MMAATLNAAEKARLIDHLKTPGVPMRQRTVEAYKVIGQSDAREAMYGACWLLAGLKGAARSIERLADGANIDQEMAALLGPVWREHPEAMAREWVRQGLEFWKLTGREPGELLRIFRDELRTVARAEWAARRFPPGTVVEVTPAPANFVLVPPSEVAPLAVVFFCAHCGDQRGIELRKGSAPSPSQTFEAEAEVQRQGWTKHADNHWLCERQACRDSRPISS